MAATPSKDKEEARVCVSCARLRAPSKFELFADGYFRNTCRECTSAIRARKASASYQSYLTTLFTQLKSSRRKENIEFTITKEEVIAIWEVQEGRCALSGVIFTHHRDGKYGDGKKKEFNASIDRINPKGPYTRENVQLVAARINTMKHTLGEDMFLWWIKNIHAHLIDKM